jgi:phosphatidylserine decarboxylase
MKLRITPYGYRECVILSTVALVLSGLIFGLAYCLYKESLLVLGVIPLLFFIFVFFFFRDPERRIPEEKEKIVAPADGKITEISEVFEEEYLKKKAIKIGIFLSIFDVHLNRAPLDGKIEYLNYKHGKFINALNHKSSELNESNSIGFCSGKRAQRRFLVKQIAGVIARRIVCDKILGDYARHGEVIGMIKFGSRTELFIPVDIDFKLLAKVGDKVKAGESVLGIIGGMESDAE